ncbi:MAG: hypothetical protein ACR2K1_14115 [Saprospiraceae bacterium]
MENSIFPIWLQEIIECEALPAGEKLTAIIECNNLRAGIYPKANYEDSAESLAGAFDWTKVNPGFDFWNNIHTIIIMQ